MQAALGVPEGLHYESCSERVGTVLGRDVMKSVEQLIPDLLGAYPLLLFQGHRDIQDGPTSTEAWCAACLRAGRLAGVMTCRGGSARRVLGAQPGSVVLSAPARCCLLWGV